MLKKGVRKEILPRLRVLEWHESFFASDYHSVVAADIGLGPWLRKRASRLMFWAAAAKQNCSRTDFRFRKRSRQSPWSEAAGLYPTLLSLPDGDHASTISAAKHNDLTGPIAVQVSKCDAVDEW